MQTSEEVKDLVTALSKAQGLIAGAVKDVENKHFKTKYADLASVWEVARKPLSDNGLSVIQSPENSEGGGIKLVTRIYHTTGQWIESFIEIPVQKQDSQGYGTTISYARRYSFAAMIGVYSEDDDGQSNGEAKKDVKKLLQKEPVGEWAAKLQNIKKDKDFKAAIKALAKDKKFKSGQTEEAAQFNFELITSYEDPKKEEPASQVDSTGGDEYY